MTVISLDIGTTKICATAIDSGSGDVLEVLTETNCFMSSDNAHERIQDTGRIAAIVDRLFAALVQKYAPIRCVGITGQMHGIVYLDTQGEAIGPFYTWQDECGFLPFTEDFSYAEYLSRTSGYAMASGFGLTTLFYHTHTGQLPANAAQFCTIHDFVAMQLVGRKKPLIHVTDAASFGFWNAAENAFDRAAIAGCGMDVRLLPEVTAGCEIIGQTKEDIPVCVAIGDNQASFLGSVDNMEECIQVNIGTGSQISVSADRIPDVARNGLELRPYFDGKTLLTGSPLCGGRAYALLENLFRSIVELTGGDGKESLYTQMGQYLMAAGDIENPLMITTKFSGTRENPSERGRIENITFDNFTPVHLMHGFLSGIAQELYDMVEPVCTSGDIRYKRLVAAGNGVRKNPALGEILSTKFALPVRIPVHCEEAAYGAALFAMTGLGQFEGLAEAQRMIRYE